jgi:hypothetical protein
MTEMQQTCEWTQLMCLFWQNWNAWQYENADGMTALLKISKQM